MTKEEIYSKTDLTLLKPTITEKEMELFLNKAIELNPYSVCVNPCWVAMAKLKLKKTDIGVCTVIDFPLGASPINTKVLQAVEFFTSPDEIDYVINIGMIKSGNWDYIRDEAQNMREEIDNEITIKCIIETCYLTADEIIKASEIIIKAGIDYVKTSTGFGEKGANLLDCELIRKTIGTVGKIKASGGINKYSQAERFLQIVDRIGSSGYDDNFDEGY